MVLLHHHPLFLDLFSNSNLLFSKTSKVKSCYAIVKDRSRKTMVEVILEMVLYIVSSPSGLVFGISIRTRLIYVVSEGCAGKTQ